MTNKRINLREKYSEIIDEVWNYCMERIQYSGDKTAHDIMGILHKKFDEIIKGELNDR